MCFQFMVFLYLAIAPITAHMFQHEHYIYVFLKVTCKLDFLSDLKGSFLEILLMINLAL